MNYRFIFYYYLATLRWNYYNRELKIDGNLTSFYFEYTISYSGQIQREQQKLIKNIAKYSVPFWEKELQCGFNQ